MISLCVQLSPSTVEWHLKLTCTCVGRHLFNGPVNELHNYNCTYIRVHIKIMHQTHT